MRFPTLKKDNICAKTEGGTDLGSKIGPMIHRHVSRKQNSALNMWLSSKGTFSGSISVE